MGFIQSINIHITEFNAASVFMQAPSVCLGEPIVVSANASGTNSNFPGYGFTWSANTSTVDAATYTLTTNQTVSVTVYDTVCGISTTVTDSITIYPILNVFQVLFSDTILQEYTQDTITVTIIKSANSNQTSTSIYSFNNYDVTTSLGLLPISVNFNAGQDTVQFQMYAIIDSTTENVETFQFIICDSICLQYFNVSVYDDNTSGIKPILKDKATLHYINNNIVLSNLKTPVNIELYDAIGQKIIATTSDNLLDNISLWSGIYIYKLTEKSNTQNAIVGKLFVGK